MAKIKPEKTVIFDQVKYLKDVITRQRAIRWDFDPLTFSEVDFKLFEYALLVQFEKFEVQKVSGPTFQLHAYHMQQHAVT